MNVPVYAAALIAFAGAYLGLDLFLGYSFLIALSAMALVLVAQLIYASRSSAITTSRSGEIPLTAASRNWIDRQVSGDSVITVIFFGVTWGIFTFLGPTPPQFVGRGLTYPGATVGTETDLLVLGAVLLLGAAVAFLLYQHARAEVHRLRDRLEWLVGDAIRSQRGPEPLGNPLGSAEDHALPEACQIEDAIQFEHWGAAVRGGPPLDPHSETLVWITLGGPAPRRSERFAVCTDHLQLALIPEILFAGWRMAAAAPA